MREKDYLQLDLRLFDGEGGAPSGAAGEGAAGEGAAAGNAAAESNVSAAGRRRASATVNPLENVKYGIQEGELPAAGAEETESDATGDNAGSGGAEGDTGADGETPEGESFEELINGKYKGEFDKYVQKIINQRFRETKALEKERASLAPILTVLADKYGKDTRDTAGILEAMQADDAIYEAKAMERGMSVEQYRDFARVMNENRLLRERYEADAERQKIEEIQAQWRADAEKTKEQFPQLDFETELNNPDMTRLLGAGVDFATAYQVAHRDEISRGLLRYTEQKARRDVVNSIASRASRPPENGVRSQAAGVVKTKVADFTKEDMQEIRRRVRNGERIVF